MTIHDLIAGLSQPEAYPFPVDTVEVHQTHLSVVFLAGPFAYKIKKPVQLGFVDFSTIELRHHFCQEEVRLNRRLAPSVYLGVVPITCGQSGLHAEGQGEIVDWAVKMERLPAEATLEQALKRGQAGPKVLEDLARRLAEFHRKAERGERIAQLGRWDVVAGNARENFEQVRAHVGQTISETVFERLRKLTESWLLRLKPLIDRRFAAGQPCDTHGDLHLDHVYLFPEKKPPDDLVIIDCIEFSDRFRF